MKGTENHGDQSSKDKLEELFRHASARERPPAASEQSVRQALHAEWTGLSRHRRRRRRLVAWAAAASVLLTVLIVWSQVQGPQSPGPAMQLAAVEKVMGTVLVQSSGAPATQTLEISGRLETGQQIVSAAGSRVAIRWLNGESIRMDEHSKLQLNSATGITLLAGRIYLDTAGVKPGAELIIMTPAGRVRHLGTRYMTSVSAQGTTVSVRDGRVLLEAGGKETVTGRGQQLTVSTSGTHTLDRISTYGSLWKWTEELAPIFSLDGRSMADFLDWVARETGRVVEFSSPQAEKLAHDTLLRGQLELEPIRALTVVLQTSDLISEVSAGTIVVGLLAQD